MLENDKGAHEFLIEAKEFTHLNCGIVTCEDTSELKQAKQK